MNVLLKYIILVANMTPVLFPEHLDHNKAAGNMQVLSAGFVRIMTDKNGNVEVYCSGASLTLGLDSRGEKDADLITVMLSSEVWS